MVRMLKLNIVGVVQECLATCCLEAVWDIESHWDIDAISRKCNTPHIQKVRSRVSNISDIRKSMLMGNILVSKE